MRAVRLEAGGEWRVFAARWRTSGGAGYLGLADALRAEIAVGRLRVGARLPSQRELASLLVLDRSSVVSAYNVLQGESLIRPRRGSGTWVVGRPVSGRPAFAGLPRGLSPGQEELRGLRARRVGRRD